MSLTKKRLSGEFAGKAPNPLWPSSQVLSPGTRAISEGSCTVRAAKTSTENLLIVFAGWLSEVVGPFPRLPRPDAPEGAFWGTRRKPR